MDIRVVLVVVIPIIISSHGRNIGLVVLNLRRRRMETRCVDCRCRNTEAGSRPDRRAVASTQRAPERHVQSQGRENRQPHRSPQCAGATTQRHEARRKPDAKTALMNDASYVSSDAWSMKLEMHHNMSRMKKGMRLCRGDAPSQRCRQASAKRRGASAKTNLLRDDSHPTGD